MPVCSDRSRRLAAGLLLVCLTGCATASAEDFLTTKTPYQPLASYTPAPPGFVPLQTQLVARHGARAMTGMKDDLALLNMCREAQREKALTPLGRDLLKDIERLIQVQLLLGAGVEGIAKPGYANLTRTGIDEHRQLALRLLRRQPALFAAPGGRRIVVQHSGVDRARDSAYFFTRSLTQSAPALAALVEQPVVNRTTLYFHKLAVRDGASDPADSAAVTLQASLRYQQYLRSAGLQARLDAIEADARLAQAARSVLERLFSKQFVDSLARGEKRYTNSGSMQARSADGKFDASLDGDGKRVLASPIDALMALSSLYEIAPGLRHELGRDFRRYIPDDQARLLAWANDAADFFSKGPAAAEDAPVTYEMARGLLTDFFDEATAGSAHHLAVLRFTHAEIIIPLATLLGLPGSDTPVAAAKAYSYADNPWRGADVAPYSANIQWDSYRNAQGRVVVRMLFNEKETPFKPACDGARLSAGSFFYDVAALRLCYLGSAPAR